MFVFEAPIDLLSFIALDNIPWRNTNFLSLVGVAPKALEQFLSDRKDIERVVICTDNDEAGNSAVEKLMAIIPEHITVNRLIPKLKDWNEVLCHKEEIQGRKFADITLRTGNGMVPMIRMSEVQQTEVDWLWYPYIPFGKLTIIQGNPGEGKTFFIMQLAACTNRKFLPQMEPFEPFNMIFQTADDGLGDTVKPRLLSAEADLEKVLSLDDMKKSLTLLVYLTHSEKKPSEKTVQFRLNTDRPF